MSTPYPRDLVGYAGNPPHPHWPGEARIAVNFVINYEEGSEYNVHDDGFSEASLTEVGGADSGVQGRDLAAEGLFEYGSRVGIWRVLRIFKERGLPLTVFGCALALERNPAVAAAIRASGFDVCSHGWRWIKHWELTEEQERAHIRMAVESLTKTIGELPLGAQREHPAVARRGGRLPLRFGRLQRRTAVLGPDERARPLGGAVQPHAERFEVRTRRLLHGRRLFHVREGRLRRALPRGPDAAPDDVARAPPAPHRASVAGGGPR